MSVTGSESSCLNLSTWPGSHHEKTKTVTLDEVTFFVRFAEEHILADCNDQYFKTNYMDSVIYNVYLLDAFLLVSFKKCCLNKVFFPVNVVNVLYYTQYVYTVLNPAIFLVLFNLYGCPNIEPKWFWGRLIKD